MGRSRYKILISGKQPHFLTCTVINWIPIFYKKRHKTDQEHQVWEEGSHPEAIIDEKMLNQKLDYIHYNPIRRGYVEDPAHWRYSSFKNYIGEEGLLPIKIIG